MTVVIKRSAADMPVDQWCRIIEIKDPETIYGVLLGTGDPIKFKATDIVGIELNETVSIYFNVVEMRRRS